MSAVDITSMMQESLRGHVEYFFNEMSHNAVQAMLDYGVIDADIDNEEYEELAELLTTAKVILKWGR